MLILRGMLYIFVDPNENSILALSLKNPQEVNQEMIVHKIKSGTNATSLKNVIPYYS